MATTLAVVLFSIILVSIPLYDFIRHLYGWHFRQPSFVQGGIELLAIAVVLFVCGFIRGKTWKYILLIGITEGYLRRHNVDLAFLIAFLFAESLIGLGYVFFRSTLGYKIPTFFISGASLFVLISMGLSLFESAKMVPLIALSSIVLVFLYATVFRESLLCKLSGAVRFVYSCDHLTRLASLLLYICLLMLAAKTAYKISYDEAWYSLRLIEVLNPSGNFFENLKLLGNWVHQYPKFFEILIFPLQYFESFTVSKVFSVIVLGIGLIAAHEFWEGYQLSAKQRALMSVVLISIPVVACDAVSAKADFFAGFVFLLSVLYFLKGVNERNIGFLFMSMGVLSLTLAIKLSAMAYLPIFLMLYVYAVLVMRGELSRASGEHVAMTILFIASFCVVTWRTFEITGVPIVSIADMSPTIASLYGLLGMEYKYPYGHIPGVVSRAKIDSLSLLLRTFVFPTGVRQSNTWVSNIVVPFAIMALIWFLKFKRGKYEALLVVFSGFLMIGVIGLIFNVKGVDGGDGNYYLIPMMVIIVVGATAFKWMSEYTLAITLLCSIYIAANLPIAFVSSQSWHVGTRGFDLVFNAPPFNKNNIQIQKVKANGLLDVRDHFTSLDQRKCVAIAEGGNDSPYQLGCRLEKAQTILWSKPYLNANQDSFVGMLKEKSVTHLVVQNYLPNSYFGRFCWLLIDSVGAKVSRFEYWSVIDIRDIKSDDLMRFAVLASMPINAINLDNRLPYTINLVNGGDIEETSSRVDFNPPRSGINKYYSPENKVIFMKSDAAIEFLVDTKGRCVYGVEAYFAKQIHSSGQKLQGGKFTMTIFSEGKKLGEKIFSVNDGKQIYGKVQLNDRPNVFKVSVKYESDDGQSKSNIPAVIVNPRVRFCE
ncbi:MAG: hypothetical protein HOP23_11110 [Methylococcaceae bacterium]|nr:hypothetical protein [Methylococcaceae bacterium]